MRRQDAQQRAHGRRGCAQRHQTGDEFLAVHVSIVPFLDDSPAGDRYAGKSSGQPAANVHRDWGFFTARRRWACGQTSSWVFTMDSTRIEAGTWKRLRKTTENSRLSPAGWIAILVLLGLLGVSLWYAIRVWTSMAGRSYERLGLAVPGARRGGHHRARRGLDGTGFLLLTPRFRPLEGLRARAR